MRDESGFRTLEDAWIPLADGVRLAARIWLPVNADREPVPAILEYLPYRRRDGTCVRDECTYPGFARAGYAGVRVDIRGNGDSDGFMTDEYTPQELADAVEVIEWIASQDWCTGNVGMMGISWGGFNSLQVAALAPKPLKAVIAIATSVDRFNDDIHYKGGCQLSANFSWASTMLSHSSRPPDPAIVGERWRDMWLARLREQSFLLDKWLCHPRKDEYWRHGSISENFAAIEAAALVIGGWADGYKNAPPAAVKGLGAPVKAVNGPWIHKYPHFAYPKPRMDFLAEAIRWWDRWLKGVENGAEALPAYRAYVTEGVVPGPRREADPGRWVEEDVWPSAAISMQRCHLRSDDRLLIEPGPGSVKKLCSPQDSGTACGEYFSLRPDADLAGDQRQDDVGSLLFESDPLSEPLELLGRPRLSLRVAIDAPVGNIAVRLLDALPDGNEYRVSLGVLNLTHRRSHSEPASMTPSVEEDVVILLDECGHRFLPGHRIRVAVSTAYWPYILPPPRRVTATIVTGSASFIELPVRVTGASPEVPEPADPDPLPRYAVREPPEVRRWVERDLTAGITRYHVLDDSGVTVHPEHGMIMRDVRREVWSIRPDDPLSCEGQCHHTAVRARDDWSTNTESQTELTMDASHFHIKARLRALEGEDEILQRDWAASIARDLM